MKQTVKTLSPAKSLSSRYNGGLDFWKLVFTFVIVMYHAGEIGEWDNFFPVGATAVEFFFILSGYFMAVSAVKKPPLEAGTLGRETAGFIWHKIKSILPYYLFGYAISLLTYGYFILRGESAGTIVDRLSKAIPNFLLLSTSGLEETTVLGVTWYISAMLLAMCFLYPLLRKYRDMYLHVIAPLSAILMAGYLCQKYGHFSLSYELDIFVTKEILRAVVGLNIGCTVYVVSEKLKKVSFTTLSRVLLAVVEWGCYLWVLLGMHFKKADYVFVELFLYFFALSITTSKQSILGHVFDHNFIKATNRFSLALYLCHSACRRVIRYLEPDWGYWETIIIFLLISAATAIVCMVMVAWIEKILRKYAPVLKKVWVQSSNNQI